MSTGSKIAQTVVIAALATGICATEAQGQLMPPKDRTNSGTFDAWSTPGTAGSSKSTDSASSKIPPEKKEKRGNAPPGKDRAGDAPASGAIVDPGGVTKK